MDTKRLLEVYLGELADRAARFYQHLEAVETEFYSAVPSLDGTAASLDKPAFLTVFREGVETILKVAAELGDRMHDERQSVIGREELLIVRGAFVCLNELHEKGLIHLPRPSEPIELRRFCRVISRHILKNDSSRLAVYVTESAVNSAYAADPISALKQKEIGALVEQFNGLNPANILFPPEVSGTKAIHVTIPRIDARNPVRWPTLFHEAAHKLLTPQLIGGKSLQDVFKSWLPPGSADEVDKTVGRHIDHWLTEVWCDLFATLVMGPAFFFSQFAVFVSTPPITPPLGKDHPPHSFRLRLMKMFLQHRYDIVKENPIREYIDECVKVVEHWDHFSESDIHSDEALMGVFNHMRGFFQEQFFSGQATEGENFQNKFDSMIAYVRSIDFTALQRMESALVSGLPIPSKRRPGIDDAVIEDPTSLQEVLFAGWLARLSSGRQEILDLLIKNRGDIPLVLRMKILPFVERSDEALRRSLQVAEWLHLFKSDSPPRPGLNRRDQSLDLKKKIPALLVDHQIFSLIYEGDLQVIPLVDLDQQLGSTSLDIRLGTSFEVFLPASRRTPYPASESANSYESHRIDLDFLEHVVLLPGQFMLAHSFEYLRLPNWLAAQLDGRSSYARLGLEVHMTAGLIDPGFEGVVTLELTNNGPNPIQLFPGLRIAQLRFIGVEEPVYPYSKRHVAKYRGLLEHRVSLFQNDPDFRRIQDMLRSLRDLSVETPQDADG